MITEIGIAAGEVWHFLDKSGDCSLSQLIEGIKQPKEVILMSLGWLAREGHIFVKYRGGNYTVSLKEK